MLVYIAIYKYKVLPPRSYPHSRRLVSNFMNIHMLTFVVCDGTFWHQFQAAALGHGHSAEVDLGNREAPSPLLPAQQEKCAASMLD